VDEKMYGKQLFEQMREMKLPKLKLFCECCNTEYYTGPYPIWGFLFNCELCGKDTGPCCQTIVRADELFKKKYKHGAACVCKACNIPSNKKAIEEIIRQDHIYYMKHRFDEDEDDY
jgi:hypothetical protein